MSNCINNGLNKIFILTQFNSTSLNRHIARTYNVGNGINFGDGFVEVLAATQRPGEAGKGWFQGTTYAIRQFIWLFEDRKNKNIEHIVILLGDHLYRMDYMDFVQSELITGIGLLMHKSLGTLSSAMNQLLDEAIALAAAAVIERELQITPWNLSSNFVACTNQIMLDRNTRHPRGFGFVTFADQRAMEDAISEMHGKELDGRMISVNRALPKLGAADDHGYGGYGGGGYGGGGRGSYGGGGDKSVGRSDCFKCGHPGHWARECPSGGAGSVGGSGGGGRFSSRSKFGGGGGRGDRFGGDHYGDRYIDYCYDGDAEGRYGDRDRMDNRDSRYAGGAGGGSRDRYTSDRYPPPVGDRFPSDRYGGSGRYPQNGYGKERVGYDREGGPRGSSDMYGRSSGGPARYEGGGGYRDRPRTCDWPNRRGPVPA